MTPRPRSRPGAPTLPTLLMLAGAIEAGRQVELGYLDVSGEATVRAVDPLALAFAGGPWLLAAHCRLRGAFRTFRLERIQGSRLLDRPATCGPPPGFSARAFATRSFAPEGAGPRASVRLTGGLRGVAHALLPSALLEAPAPGQLLCHLRAQDLAALAGLVASLGEGADLVHPAEGVAAIRQVRSHLP